MIIFLLMITGEPELDMMVKQLGISPPLETVININNGYLQHDAFNKAINLLRTYENTYQDREELQAKLEFQLAEDYFFSSEIIKARNHYLKMAQAYPASIEANNALERLYQIEGMRVDTTVMKRIMYAVCLCETDRGSSGRDSLLKHLDSKIGDYAYYFLAQVYRRLGDLPMALGALQAISDQFPKSRIMGLPILMAEICIDTKDYENARTLLEDYLVRDPLSIFGARARQLLSKIPI